jgi:hypothetical protein
MSLALKPSHAAVKNYYAALHQVGHLHFNNEAQVSDAFAKLLADCSDKATPRDSGSNVEERRLSAASVSKKDSRALAPVASDAEIFRTLVKVGQRLAEIHVHYEQQPDIPSNRRNTTNPSLLDYPVALPILRTLLAD